MTQFSTICRILVEGVGISSFSRFFTVSESGMNDLGGEGKSVLQKL